MADFTSTSNILVYIRRGFIDRNPLANLRKLEEQEWTGPRPTEDIVDAVLAKLDKRVLPLINAHRMLHGLGK